ncbi:hypothetical protein THOM_2207, partial [Trachipleistophora hominis]
VLRSNELRLEVFVDGDRLIRENAGYLDAPVNPRCVPQSNITVFPFIFTIIHERPTS